MLLVLCFADLKIYLFINPVKDCIFHVVEALLSTLQADINFTQNWYGKNYVEF
jgi:hypothetical protein